ncbi:hypothetical protein BKA67DRAFT_551729 [Truncatella angustata]|uniref:Uncharacterized protein n=1 Tax=Truncatella angustata TaxID=152316 RepID=A0A9P8UPA0_9PEZI|nr:uncharacterized protein BKA67DRAFT_551729 [Truncatella angustata]KAH6656365.1 hypothetical protein BKA67DRAFT_551729 [Truncatella angustata]
MKLKRFNLPGLSLYRTFYVSFFNPFLFISLCGFHGAHSKVPKLLRSTSPSSPYRFKQCTAQRNALAIRPIVSDGNLEVYSMGYKDNEVIESIGHCIC